ncbi:hypothetical protein M947_11490 [Sulfurimonas hongkongensis]|uniref:Uncharacterized protein n=1 Tax=Sulfurimonas hongkongensis TaxID=1172190 RepID=T0KLR1_9BACT|nr:hypothetical protein [Sulfurimonas hongkongensis]EQB34313.1 hypothetical protein M947_11490 [Sulfurimonas hongkongensis]
MKNPFESGHIKNYVLLYISVVAIMVLFFIASSIFIEDVRVEKKEFVSDMKGSKKELRVIKQEQNRSFGSGIKLLDKAY